jgi:multidrug efflux pump subunit AcrA (membrane-fusion protein)
VALATALLSAGCGLRPDRSGDDPGLGRVERRDFVSVRRLHGVVEATRSHRVAVPRMEGGSYQLTLTRLAEAGSHVAKGDLLAEFDRQEQVKTLREKEGEFRDAVAAIDQKRAEHEAAEATEATELEAARVAVGVARLETVRNEVLSRIEAEINRNSLEEAEAHLQQLQATQEAKLEVREAELAVLEIRRERARVAMSNAEGNAARMVMRSPIAGIVVLNSIWRGGSMGEVRVGDQVRRGVPFLQVVDPTEMRVRCKVHQLDLPRLEVGRAAETRLDAYPDLVLPSRLTALGAIGVPSQNSDRLRTFEAVFRIEGSDPRLLPDLSASVDVELERRPSALVAPRDALVFEGEQAFLRVKGALGFHRVAVRVETRSDLEAVVDGVDEGAWVQRGPAGAGS